MDFRDIFSDALTFPFNNIVSFILFIVLGIIAGIAVGGALAGVAFGMSSNNILAVLGSGFVGFVIALIVFLIISGYQLDIIKSGIQRIPNGPGIDPVRQLFNGLKLFVISIVYYIIPFIIVSVLSIFLRDWLMLVLSFILYVVFALAQFMAQCRLAKTEDLGYALSIGEAIGDISKVGILNLLIFVVISILIVFLLVFIAALIARWNSYVGGVILGIVGVYIIFFIGRATGLLYSNV